MKKLFLLISILLLFDICASAQMSNKLVNTFWVLQNPELAVNHTVMTFGNDGQLLYEVSNLLTKEKTSSKFFWKLNKENLIITITTNDGSSLYQADIIIDDNNLTMTNQYDKDDIDYWIKSGSTNDYYLSRVKNAVEMYGTDASLRKNGFPSSSRETGYSFYPRYSTCSGCYGSGRCLYCNGSGRVTYNYRDYTNCPSCHGSGTCFLCNGHGKIKNY